MGDIHAVPQSVQDHKWRLSLAYLGTEVTGLLSAVKMVEGRVFKLLVSLPPMGYPHSPKLIQTQPLVSGDRYSDVIFVAATCKNRRIPVQSRSDLHWLQPQPYFRLTPASRYVVSPLSSRGRGGSALRSGFVFHRMMCARMEEETEGRSFRERWVGCTGWLESSPITLSS